MEEKPLKKIPFPVFSVDNERIFDEREKSELENNIFLRDENGNAGDICDELKDQYETWPKAQEALAVARDQALMAIRTEPDLVKVESNERVVNENYLTLDKIISDLQTNQPSDVHIIPPHE